jgi:LacI family transcriptional regulator
MSLVFRNLRHLGYERIGVLFSREMDSRFDFAWEAGLAVAAGIFGSMRLPPVVVTEQMGVAQLKKWLDRHKPDVIVDGGLGLDRHLAKLGMEMPHEIGYVSLLADGSPEGAATVRPDWQALGAAALDVVAEQLIHNERGIPAKPRTVLIEGEWMPGATVRDCRKRSVARNRSR